MRSTYTRTLALIVALGAALWCCQTNAAANRSHAHKAHRPSHHEDGHVRAGCPQQVRRFAQPTYTSDYASGWVGGGALWRGEPRTLEEGIWGRDYIGRKFQRRVFLDWWHGERYQGGEGAYKSDGPRILHELHAE